MGRLSTQREGRVAPRQERALETVAGLEQLAKRKRIQPPKEGAVLSAVRTVGGLLNVGTAAAAGGTRALLRGENILGGVARGISERETLGFGDIIREDLGIKPESRLGKIGVGAAGFVADIVFDPLTYLTFGLGAGLKVGGRTLTKAGTVGRLVGKKGGTELFQQAAREAATVLGNKGEGVALDLFQRALGKKGITEEAARGFLDKGIQKETIDEIVERGQSLVSRGGIQFAGRRLEGATQLAEATVGKAFKRLGETEAVQAIKTGLGKLFVADFQRDPRLVGILDKASREERRAIQGLLKANEELFQGLSDEQMGEFFTNVFKKKKEVVSFTREIQQSSIEKFKELFPGIKLENEEQARKLLGSLEEETISRVSKIRERIDAIVAPYFEKRRQRIAQVPPALPGKTKELAIQPVVKTFARVDDLNRVIDGLREELKELRKTKGAIPLLGKREAVDLGGEITERELKEAASAIINHEEERLAEVVEKLSKQIERLREAPQGVAGAPRVSKISAGEAVALSERLIRKLQSDLTEKTLLLESVTGARRAAKARQKGEHLIFSDPKLQEISDKLFEGDNAIVPRFARAAGISEEDAIKFYIPSKFEDKITVKEYMIGKRLSSPSLGFLEEFRGVEEGLIRNPFEAFTRGQVEVVTARIKTDAIEAVVKNLGKPIEELTEAEAKRLDFVKFSRKGIRGEIQGWLPQNIAEDLNRFIAPQKGAVEELARITGFDAATGLFKSYVTSLFPGFHIRNITSNQFQNMLKIGTDNLNPALHKRALDVVRNKNPEAVLVAKTGKRMTNKELRKLIEQETDILETGAFGRFEQLLEEGKKRIQRGTPAAQKFNVFSRENIALEKARGFGRIAEAQAKVVSIISAVMEGKSVREGVRQAEEAIFNYAKLSDFEKSVMRRLVPFYTFARKNAELQVRALATTPGRVAAQMKAVRAGGEAIGEPLTEEDIQGLPNFVLENLGIKGAAFFDNKFGQKTFLTGFGLPIEEFLQRFSGEDGIVSNTILNVLSQANPFLKIGVERAIDKDFFRNRPITEITNGQSLKPFFDALEAAEPTKKVSEQLKDLIQWAEIPNQPVHVGKRVVAKKTKYTANPFALHLLRNLFTSRIQSTIGFLGTEDENTFNKLLRFFTGVRGWSIDQEEQKFFNELERKRELQDYLIRMGVLKKFERAFEPKKSRFKPR